MPRSYSAPLQFIRFAVFGSVLTAAMLPVMAGAQGYYEDNAYPQRDRYDAPVIQAPVIKGDVDGDDEDAYYNSRDYTDERGVPYAGRDLGYDYLDNEYYRYDGQPVQDRRAREQDGWRDGVLHTAPRGYYWRSWYDRGCGCTRGSYYRVYNAWGQHEYRQLYSRYDYDRGYSGDRAYYSRYDRRSSYTRY